jgi:uncharacterized membrane protein YkoI
VKHLCHVFLIMLALSFRSSSSHAAPQLSMPEAKKIALARVPGTVVHEKLKHKKKGHDVYSIKIKPRDHVRNGFVKKVEIDKESGQIVKIKDVKAKSYDE